MRGSNFIIFFLIIFVSLATPVGVRCQQLTVISDLKQSYTLAMESAVDDAMDGIVESDSGDAISLNKQFLLDRFFHTLFINLGCTADTVKQNAIKAYIPIVLLVDTDGYYIYYSDTASGSDGETIIAKNWTDKLTFTYVEENGGRIFNFTLGDVVNVYDPNTNHVFNMDYRDLAKLSLFNTDDPDNKCYRSSLLCDGNFDAIRRTTIINAVTDSMTYYINQHNRVAQHYGFTYHFSLPYISEDDWARTIDDISMIAFFQGYPYVSDAPQLGYFNLYSIGGARVVKPDYYYIMSDSTGTKYYHKKNCVNLSSADFSVWTHPYEDPRQCAKKGAFPCPDCNP